MAQISSGASSDILTIDPASKAARATLYNEAGESAMHNDGDTSTNYPGMLMMGRNDRSILPIRADRMGSLASALHTPMFHDSFEGGSVNPLRWLITATTQTAAQATITGLTFNSGAVTTLNTGYMAQSGRKFLKPPRAPLHGRFRARANHVNNSVMELGFGDAATYNGANSTGAYWQWTSSGVCQPVVTFNGTDQTGADVRSLLSNTNYYTFDVLMDDDEATFLVQDTSTGLILSKQTIRMPVTGQRLLSAVAIGVQMRQYHTGSAPATAPQLFVTDCYVLTLDQAQNKPWPHVMATMHRNSIALQATGLQSAAWTNSAEPGSSVLSNTIPGNNTLGGKFQFAAVAGSATDYALFGHFPSANLVITGIDIDTWNTGAAVATTPTMLTWAVGVGNTAITLASGAIARNGLGAQVLPVGAAIGAMANRISKSYQTPLYVDVGRMLHIILRIPVATATASQVIAGMVNIEGYYD